MEFERLVAAVVAAEAGRDAGTDYYERVALALHHVTCRNSNALDCSSTTRVPAPSDTGHPLITGCLAMAGDSRED